MSITMQVKCACCDWWCSLQCSTRRLQQSVEDVETLEFKGPCCSINGQFSFNQLMLQHKPLATEGQHNSFPWNLIYLSCVGYVNHCLVIKLMDTLQVCKFCQKVFKHSSSLSGYVKSEHEVEQQENGSISCNDLQCKSK